MMESILHVNDTDGGSFVESYIKALKNLGRHDQVSLSACLPVCSTIY